MNPYDFFAAAAARHPRHPAVEDERQRLDYGQLLSKVEQAACVIDELREPGRPLHIAVFSPNCVEALSAMLTVFRTGSVWVPVNARNALEDNLLILQRSDVDVLLVHSEFASTLERIRGAVPSLRAILCIDGELPAAPPLNAHRHTARARPRQENSHAVCAMLSTGGTTGLPKGVVWPESVVEAMVASFWVHLPAPDHPVYLAAAPLTHASGVIGLCLLARGATVLIHRAAKPQEIMRTIGERGVTHLFLPPTVIYAMLADPEVRNHDYRSLRYFIYTAAPMAPDKIREAMDVFGPVMVQLYGQAEVPLMGTVFTPQDHARFLSQGRLDKFGSCGLPTLLARVEVMDDQGGLLGARGVGEVVFRGPLVMRGYYKSPDETAAAAAQGWHHTGDVGFKDEDGYLHIVDRKKDMIITGGFNVYSSEVERVVMECPGVGECAVIGAPDARWGEAVTAIVEGAPGQEPDPEYIRAHCRQRLGGVKAPKSVLLWPSLPRSAVGKVLKREIRERFWADQVRRV
jgi:acyl-CoA synthetase (AMP-forming)/AMP-acid ligase II